MSTDIVRNGGIHFAPPWNVLLVFVRIPAQNSSRFVEASTTCYDFKAQAEHCSHGKSATSKAAFKTSSSSIVLSLPKVMKDFVQTRDGQGNVVVRTESLKRQFKNLYYKSLVTPTQVFSNSFILQLAGERMKYSSSLRDCELWCRKDPNAPTYCWERQKVPRSTVGHPITRTKVHTVSWKSPDHGIQTWRPRKKMGFNQEKVNTHTCASFLKDAKMHWHWQIKMSKLSTRNSKDLKRDNN